MKQFCDVVVWEKPAITVSYRTGMTVFEEGLRDGIGLRAYGQRDPVIEYKREGYEMFEEMVRLIQEDTIRRLYFTVLAKPMERTQVAKPTTESHGETAEQPKKPAKTAAKVGRNDPCPCGSGKKYKNCCGKQD